MSTAETHPDVDEVARTLRTEYLAYMVEKGRVPSQTSWEDLPPARREKWLRMARTALDFGKDPAK